MTNQYCVFLYIKDFQLNGNDRYFLLMDNKFIEVDASYLTKLNCYLITHDYSIIIDSIYKKASSLPKNVIDISDFKKFLLQQKISAANKDQIKIKEIIKSEYDNNDDLRNYFEIYYRKKDYNEDTYMFFSHKLLNKFEYLLNEAENTGEKDRYFDVEIPCYNQLCRHLVTGIKIDIEKLKIHKSELNITYYKKLKAFAEKFNFMYEMPSDKDLKEYVLSKGYQFENESLDYILDFLPMQDDFGKMVRDLQKTNITRNVLLGIPHSRNSITPSIDLNGSVTSRIYLKSPGLQNIAKKYRDIFIASAGQTLSYVDYDQFEIGIMAHYSDDPNLINMYDGYDIYEVFSSDVFGTSEKRKIAKRIFLSFIYGMSLNNLNKAVFENGGDVEKSRVFFAQFSKLEEWRKHVANQFLENGKIGTLMGNYLKRDHQKDLDSNERRSCVSQVVQGTGSLIFKKALIELSKNKDIKIVLPMHDAVLVQHPKEFDTQILICTFTEVMKETLANDKLKPKASLSSFFAD